MHFQYIKFIRRTPMLMLVYLVSALSVNTLISYNDSNEPVRMNVDVGRELSKSTYKRQFIGENSFETGVEAKVSWKPKSFKESFVLRYIVKDDSSFSLFGFVLGLILNGIFYWMVYDVNAGNLFSTKVLNGSYLISATVVIYLLVINIIKYHVSDYFIKDITDGQFRAHLEGLKFSGLPVGLVVVFLFTFLPRIISKAQQIEQDQNLTI